MPNFFFFKKKKIKEIKINKIKNFPKNFLKCLKFLKKFPKPTKKNSPKFSKIFQNFFNCLKFVKYLK